MLRNIFLARILMPECFGVSALIIAALVSIDTLTEVGIRQAVIQNNTVPERDMLSAAWFLAAARAFAIVALLFLAAPWFAQFFNLGEHVLAFRLGGLAILANCLTSPRSYLKERSLDYRRIALTSSLGSMIGIVATIVLALHYKQPWTLVAGYIIECLARCVLSYTLFPYFPSHIAGNQAFRGVSRYTKGMIGLPILTFIYIKSDIFVLSKFVPKAEVGQYALCLTVAMSPFVLTNVVARVLIASFAAHQHDPIALKRQYCKALAAYLWMCLPIIALLLFNGRSVVYILLGEKYVEMGHLLCGIFASQAIYAACSPAASLLMAVGRPDLCRLSVLVRALVGLVLIPLATYWWGVGGTVGSLILCSSIGYYLYAKCLKYVILMRISEFWELLKRPLMVAIITAASSLAIHQIKMFGLMVELCISALVAILATWPFLRYIQLQFASQGK